MANSSYAELLNRPEWKSRRLEILQRDDNTCKACGSKENLHVHHLKYLKGKNPWESPDTDLVTLCKGCHHNQHSNDGDEFVQVYLSDMGGLMGLATRGEICTMMWIWKLSSYIKDEDYPGNYIILNNVNIEIITKNIGISVGGVKNIISGLAKKGLLIKSSKRTLYFLNPKYFFKGSIKDRIKSYTISINYKVDDKNEQ